MIYFDVTKASRSGHHSGIQRVCAKLRAELTPLLGERLVAVRWDLAAKRWALLDGAAAPLRADDWLFTPELFSEAERPGFAEWLAQPGCRTAAVYYDAIPMKFPQTTWPQSVARHPGYMKLLARFDRVLAISEASRRELAEYWEWGRMSPRAELTVFPLGADGSGRPRVRNRERPNGVPALLLVGILEPRKNQLLLLDVAERLWSEGLQFELHLVGRVNPHFGRETERRARALSRRFGGLRYHGALADAAVAALTERCLVGVFPSRAEGNGLPVIEALWNGLPCVCSDVPALSEHSDGGGCLSLPVDGLSQWVSGIRRVVMDEPFVGELTRQALNRPLPMWRDSAKAVGSTLS